MLVATKLMASQILHHELGDEPYWEVVGLEPFDELIVSWEAPRPEKEGYLFQIALFDGACWSPWIDYAFWGACDQYTLQPSQDCIETEPKTGFKVRVKGAQLRGCLHACLTLRKEHQVGLGVGRYATIRLEVGGLSQMALDDPRAQRLCSPTATTAAIRYLKGENLDPLLFADKVWDSRHDIYGNWILNTAEAAYRLGSTAYVARLTSFDPIYESLTRGFPVVVSVRSPLVGSAQEYVSGHLIAVIGYDAEQNKVFCMDPAFSTDEKTLTSYPLADFLAAWNRRQGVAYLFVKGPARGGDDRLP